MEFFIGRAILIGQKRGGIWEFFMWFNMLLYTSLVCTSTRCFNIDESRNCNRDFNACDNVAKNSFNLRCVGGDYTVTIVSARGRKFTEFLARRNKERRRRNGIVNSPLTIDVVLAQISAQQNVKLHTERTPLLKLPREKFTTCWWCTIWTTAA